METITRGHNLSTTVNNFSLSYDDVGEGRIPIIFLHGFPFNKTMWKGQLDCFQSEYRLIACDIRGFGKSKDENSHLSIDLFAEDLVVFMDNLNIEKAILCGLSMGGFIALNAMRGFPDRFEALILCDTQCIADSAETKLKRYMVINDTSLDGTNAFSEGFVKNVFHDNTITQNKPLVEKLRNDVFANSQHIIGMGLKAIADHSETCSILDGIAIPTLIICGRADAVTPLAESEFMKRSIKGSILTVVEDAGHVSNLEQPDVFNKHLGDFLRGLDIRI